MIRVDNPRVLVNVGHVGPTCQPHTAHTPSANRLGGLHKTRAGATRLGYPPPSPPTRPPSPPPPPPRTPLRFDRCCHRAAASLSLPPRYPSIAHPGRRFPRLFIPPAAEIAISFSLTRLFLAVPDPSLPATGWMRCIYRRAHSVSSSSRWSVGR